MSYFSICNMHFTSYLVHKCFFSFLSMQLVCQLHVERPVDLWQEFVSILPVVYVNFIRNMTYYIGPFFPFRFLQNVIFKPCFIAKSGIKIYEYISKRKKKNISIEKCTTINNNVNNFSLHIMAKLVNLLFSETRVNVVLIKYLH